MNQKVPKNLLTQETLIIKFLLYYILYVEYGLYKIYLQFIFYIISYMLSTVFIKYICNLYFSSYFSCQIPNLHEAQIKRYNIFQKKV
jgi:hypothetical protein